MTNEKRADRAFNTLLGTYINRDGATDFEAALTAFMADAMHEMALHRGGAFDEILENARREYSETSAEQAA